ncbi:MAG: hypothetical protein ABI360_01450 [Allobranchiibius sp.]
MSCARHPIRVYLDSIGTDPTKAEVSYQVDNPARNPIGRTWVQFGRLWHNGTC